MRDDEPRFKYGGWLVLAFIGGALVWGVILSLIF